MGYPLSPVLACMVMFVIEQNAIETFFKPSSIWVRYVDDVYSIDETNQIALFHDHLNTTSSSIKFTKQLESEGTLSFLDDTVIRRTDGHFQQTSTENLHTQVDIFLFLHIIL